LQILSILSILSSYGTGPAAVNACAASDRQRAEARSAVFQLASAGFALRAAGFNLREQSIKYPLQK
jgi:hypothetical protein